MEKKKSIDQLANDEMIDELNRLAKQSMVEIKFQLRRLGVDEEKIS